MLANDTDADGDPFHVATWDWQPTHGDVVELEDGKLMYTPFPDFNGTDTFTYAASDGLESDSATVTVTVNSVNDAPIGFNDAYQFTHGSPPYPYYPFPIPYSPVAMQSVLANDADVDGTPSYIADLDTSGTVGTISMNMGTGTFDWYGPATFYGATSFRYQAGDSGQASSDWVTVKLWALAASPTSDGIYANEDTYPIGGEAQTWNVTDNDSGGTVAVLMSRPTAKRITSFDFDGTLKYSPGLVPVDASLNYRLFSADGKVSADTKVDMTAATLAISDGQGGATVRAEDRATVGAFTVVNKNDTDGDGVPDNVDNKGVRAADGVGDDEKDLMKLQVKKPAGFGANDTLTVTVTHGDARFFRTALREDNLGQTFTLNAASFTVNGQQVDALDYWVEIYEPANGMRDISIQMKYQNATNTVKATGVWSTVTNFRTTGTSLSPAANRTLFNTTFVYSGGALGQLTMARATDAQIDAAYLTAEGKALYKTLYNTGNAVEIEFTVQPQLIGLSPQVRFDISRSAALDSKYAAGVIRTLRTQPDFLEDANDENPSRTNPDNDVDLWWAGRAAVTGAAGGIVNTLYSFDRPGLATERRIFLRDDRFQQRGNFWEFVRVKIGSDFNFGKLGLQGSRASDYVNWHSWIDVSAVADPDNEGNRIWQRGAAARNEIKQDAGPQPNFEFQ